MFGLRLFVRGGCHASWTEQAATRRSLTGWQTSDVTRAIEERADLPLTGSKLQP